MFTYILLLLALSIQTGDNLNKTKEAADTISLSTVRALPGSSAVVPINLTNSDSIAGVQSTIFFSNVTLDSIVPGSRAFNMQLSSNVFPDSAIMVIVSLQGNSIPPGEGNLANLYFTIPESAQYGDTIPIIFGRTVLSDPHATRLSVQKVNGFIYIPVRDTIRAISTYGAPGANTALSFQLINDTAVSGIQVTLTYDNSLLHFTSAVLNSPYDSTFSITANNMGDSLKIVIVSLSGDSILPGRDTIFHVNFQVDTLATPGDSTWIGVRKAVLSDPHAEHIKVEKIGGWISIGGTKGDLNQDGVIDIADIVREINILLGRGNPPTAYERWAEDVNDDGEFDVTDIVATINIVLGRGKSTFEGPGFASIWINGDKIFLRNSVGVGGLQFYIRGKIEDVNLTERARGFSIFSQRDAAGIKVILISLSGNTISAGKGPILRLNGQGRLENPIVSDANGYKLNLVNPDQHSSTISSLKIYPNPAETEFTISFYLTRKAKLNVEILNSAGRQVKTVVRDKVFNPGYQTVKIDSRRLSSGIYFVNIHNESIELTRKLVVK